MPVPSLGGDPAGSIAAPPLPAGAPTAITPALARERPLQVVHGGAAAGVPRVAIVIPVHNNEDFLALSLDSVLAQTLTDWQCIVIDDGSTDTTADVARRYLRDPRFSLILQANAGSPAARNAGLANVAAGTPYVAFLDGDDIWLPDALQTLVERLDRDERAVGVYGVAEYMDPLGQPLRPGEHSARQRDRRRVRGVDLASVPPAEGTTTFAQMVVSGPIWPSAVAVHRRAVVDAVGRFDESLRLQQDWDLYLRTSRRGDYLFLDQQVAWYRQHGTNVTHRTVERVYFQDRVRHKTWASPDNSSAQRRVAARAWRALQHRRVLTAARSTVSQARAGHPRDAGRSLVGLVVLGAQLLSPGPPTPSRRLVRLTDRAI